MRQRLSGTESGKKGKVTEVLFRLKSQQKAWKELSHFAEPGGGLLRRRRAENGLKNEVNGGGERSVREIKSFRPTQTTRSGNIFARLIPVSFGTFFSFILLLRRCLLARFVGSSMHCSALVLTVSNVILSHSYFTVTADGPLHNELGEKEKSLQLFGEC
jgi:hypothetical protein